jgi:hypothetical protein
MILKSKDKKFEIKVNVKKNKIIESKGFIVISKGSHYGHTRIRSDILEKDFIIPKNITIG